MIAIPDDCKVARGDDTYSTRELIALVAQVRDDELHVDPLHWAVTLAVAAVQSYRVARSLLGSACLSGDDWLLLSSGPSTLQIEAAAQLRAALRVRQQQRDDVLARVAEGYR